MKALCQRSRSVKTIELKNSGFSFLDRWFISACTFFAEPKSQQCLAGTAIGQVLPSWAIYHLMQPPFERWQPMVFKETSFEKIHYKLCDWFFPPFSMILFLFLYFNRIIVLNTIRGQKYIYERIPACRFSNWNEF